MGELWTAQLVNERERVELCCLSPVATWNSGGESGVAQRKLTKAGLSRGAVRELRR